MAQQALNARQAAFAREYVVCGNAEQSALAAGYAKTTARHMAHRLLANVGIQDDIDRRRRAMQVRSDYTVEVWRKDVLADIEWARDQDNVAGVMKGRELLGRHIGALTYEPTSQAESNFIAFLGGYAAEQAQQLSATKPIEGVARVLDEGTQ